jgi:hypothetical protein
MDDNNKPNDFGRDVTEAKRFLGYVCVMLGALSSCNDNAFVRFSYERDWFYN